MNSPRYRNSNPQEDVQIQIRITSSLRDRLQAEANRRTVSVNLLAERALDQSLTAWEKQKLP